MWSMAQRFLGATTDPAVQSALDNLRAWLEALRPYGQASAIWVPEPPLSRVTLALGH